MNTPRIIKVKKSQLKSSTCKNCGYESETAICEQCELAKIAEDNKIKRTIWSMDNILNEKHNFQQPCCVQITCRCFEKQPRTLLEGDTWLDVWKAVEKNSKKRGRCDHIFIEGMEQEGPTIKISCGS